MKGCLWEESSDWKSMEGEKRFENLKRIGLVKGTCFFYLYV